MFVTPDRDFEEFVRANGDSLQRFAFLLTRDSAAAQDLVQSALAASFSRWSKIDPGTAKAYVSRAIINAHRRSWRKWGRAVDVSARLPDRIDTPTTSVTDDRLVLASALARLSPSRRTVVACRYYLDLTERETAELTGLSMSAVKTHSARGLQQLRAVLASQQPFEEKV